MSLMRKSFFSECSVLYFAEPGEEWLDFVSDNRSGNYKGEDYDLILGQWPMMMCTGHLPSILLAY